MNTSSIVDVPKRAYGPNSEDLFGINKYEKGLIKFISNADTPITIAIQGEWGSGHCSAQNARHAHESMAAPVPDVCK